MDIWLCIVCMIGTLLLGIVLGRKLFHSRPDGTLHIDQRDPVTDKYNLALDTGLDDVPKKKYVLFAVEVIKSRENVPL